jgi:dihydroflavonol-4-reductase
MQTGSILDRSALQESLAGCERVYHLAANPQLWNRDPRVFERVNRQGTQNVVQAVKQAKVQRLVYTSTESILAPRHHHGPIDENVQTSLDDMIGPYCRSKFLAEGLVAGLAKEGFDAVIVNPTMPIGPYDRNLTPPGKMIRNFLLGKIKGFMDGTLNYVDVRDAALGHLMAMDKGQPGERYILAGENLSVEQFFIKLAAICTLPAPTMRVPFGVALGYAYLEEAYGRLTGREPLSSVTGVRLCRRSLAFDGSRTWQKLGGHQPRPVDESLPQAVEWHRQLLRREGYRV